MNETMTLPSSKKLPSGAILGNGKPARQKARHVPAKDSPETHSQLILAAIVAYRDGDFTARLPADWAGTEGRIYLPVAKRGVGSLTQSNLRRNTNGF